MRWKNFIFESFALMLDSASVNKTGSNFFAVLYAVIFNSQGEYLGLHKRSSEI